MHTLGNAASDARPHNVDERELSHYQKLASTWWDKSGPFWPLHKLNDLRTAYVSQILLQEIGQDSHNNSSPLQEISILDVGCGGGILSESMANLGATVHGIDVAEKNIAIARHHAHESNLAIDYEVTTSATLVQRKQSYDAVLCMEVVEHVPDIVSLMRDCMRLVRPGGILVLATINRTLLSWLTAIVAAEYILGWLPRGTHRWRKFVKPRELEDLLKLGGFDEIAQTGVRVNPLTRGFSLTRTMSINYMIVARHGISQTVDRKSYSLASTDH